MKNIANDKSHIKFNIFNTIKNVLLGAFILFSFQLSRFFTPIQFLIDNSKIIITAFLHLLVPIFFSVYSINKFPSLNDRLFLDSNLFETMIGAFSLYSIFSFLWMILWILACYIANLVTRKISDLESVGASRR